MSFSSWLRNRTVSAKRGSARRFRPQLEALEDRCVPATFLVNTPLDVLGHDNGTLSLRQAILDANASPEADTIVLPVAVTNYTLTRAGVNEDGALWGDLDITGRLTIKGAGARETTVDADGLGRAFQVLSGADVTLSGVTVRGGSGESYQYFGNSYIAGGGILNEGVLTVRDSTFSGDSATEIGGGIVNVGTLTVRDSILSGNSDGAGGERGEGGGIWNDGTATIVHSTLYGNSASNAGGIYNSGTLTVSNSILSDNSAGAAGSGIFNAGTLTIRNSTLSYNTANTIGGGIYSFGTLTVSNSTLSDNSAGERGGGIGNEGVLTVRNSTFSGNSASFGGGIMNIGELTLRNSTLLGNSAMFGLGGDLYNAGLVYVVNSLIDDRYDA